MAVLATKTVNDNLVYYDNAYAHRWLDAIGPDVCKIELKAPLALQAANSLAAWKTTLVNASTIADTPDIAGGAFIITTAGAEHDGVNIHPVSEPFSFAAKWPMYFGVKLQMSNATETVFWAGLGLADDNWDTGAPNDYVAFYKADAGTTCNFQIAKNGAATTLESVHTFVAATDVTLEFYFDGTAFYVYVNGALAGSVAYSNANVPSDGEELTPTLDFTTGSGDARTCTVKWLRAIQIQNP